MKRYDVDGGIPTLAVALSDRMNADELKVLASLTKTSVPTRKAELVDHILKYLEGDRLHTVWQCLDDLQQAAVAAVVHSMGTAFPAERFHAKYGRLPNFGTVSRRPRDGHPTALRFFFYGRGGGVMPDDLKERLTAFVPPPREAEVQSLEQLPLAYDRPFERWNPRTKERQQGTEPIPLAVRDKTRRASSPTIDAIAAVLDVATTIRGLWPRARRGGPCGPSHNGSSVILGTPLMFPIVLINPSLSFRQKRSKTPPNPQISPSSARLVSLDSDLASGAILGFASCVALSSCHHEHERPNRGR